jgi:hypothetical protein
MIPQIQPPHKPTLASLLGSHRNNIEDLAHRSGIPPLVAIALLNGYGTTPRIAQATLDALNAMRGTCYTLADVEVELYERSAR